MVHFVLILVKSLISGYEGCLYIPSVYKKEFVDYDIWVCVDGLKQYMWIGGIKIFLKRFQDQVLINEQQ